MPESTGMLLLDVKKTFDSVWHEPLMHKLLMKGCDIFLARLIFSFRSFQVCVGKAQSSSCDILYGVPPPTLYNIFTSDAQMLESVSWPRLPTTLLFLCLTRSWRWFAANCNASFNTLSDYFKNWKIRVNPTKTQAIYFSRCTSVRNLPVFRGEVFGLKFRQKTHFCIANSTDMAERAFRILYSFLNRRSKLCTFANGVNPK
jgi:hypothetical protein